VLANPLFTNAAAAVFTTQASSPARKAATQALPPGFVVIDDFTTSTWRGTSASDLGAYSVAP
jgi:hypothetical protein